MRKPLEIAVRHVYFGGHQRAVDKYMQLSARCLCAIIMAIFNRLDSHGALATRNILQITVDFQRWKRGKASK
jgi:flavorubredoxin